jgi:hypothetical protein
MQLIEIYNEKIPWKDLPRPKYGTGEETRKRTISQDRLAQRNRPKTSQDSPSDKEIERAKDRLMVWQEEIDRITSLMNKAEDWENRANHKYEMHRLRQKSLDLRRKYDIWPDVSSY